MKGENVKLEKQLQEASNIKLEDRILTNMMIILVSFLLIALIIEEKSANANHLI